MRCLMDLEDSDSVLASISLTPLPMEPPSVAVNDHVLVLFPLRKTIFYFHDSVIDKNLYRYDLRKLHGLPNPCYNALLIMHVSPFRLFINSPLFHFL